MPTDGASDGGTPTSPGLRIGTASGSWVIAATVLGSAMTVIDATVVGIALPTIGREFHTDLAALQWVVSGYTLTLGALLLPGGALGDRWGRRRVFHIGVVWFTLASAACAAAPGPVALVLLRCLQGAGAALLTPGSLAILQASFATEDRGRAIGAWTGLGGVASAAGPLLGGYLITAASWRYIFVVNLPVGALVLLVSARHVPESRNPGAGPGADAAGAVLAVLALLGVTFGLIEGPQLGWTRPLTVGALGAGVVAAALFVRRQRTAANPTLPLSLFEERQFTVTNAVTFLVYGALGGTLFLLPVELQVVGGYSPLQAGLALLPLTAIMLALSARSGRLASRIGPRLQMSVGPVVMGTGLALLARAATDTRYVTGVLPAIVVLALGLAVTVAPLTATALGAAPDRLADTASAVNNVVARVGGLIAVAVLPALAGITGKAYADPHLLSAGFTTATLVTGATCMAGGLLAAVGIRNPAPAPAAVAVAVPAPPAEGGHFRHCGIDAPPLEVGG